MRLPNGKIRLILICILGFSVCISTLAKLGVARIRTGPESFDSLRLYLKMLERRTGKCKANPVILFAGPYP